MGDVASKIEPILVVENKTNRTGITFKINSEGVGANASLIPSYVGNNFFEALKKYVKDKHIDELSFSKYQKLNDKGVTEYVPASIPVTYAGFKNYLDSNNSLNNFEGIWTDPDGFYTLGVVKTHDDQRYKYYGFVIESRKRNWKAGEIKMKLTDLISDETAFGKYKMGSKVSVGVTWKVERGVISSLNSPMNLQLVFIKTYPKRIDDQESYSGAGSGWAITENGIFVTNAHVVKNARKIYVGFKDSAVEARVLIVDKRTDLALIKMKPQEKKYSPIPVDFRSNVANGTRVTVIGYPLVFTLGDNPRVTEGMINAQSGIKKDVTRYQISAPIQSGSSGGPVISQKGNVIGIAVSKLADPKTQVVNFAIKSSYLGSLLEQVGVKTKHSDERSMTSKDIFTKYKGSVLPVWTK